jgi:magnesium chelatase subunit I
MVFTANPEDYTARGKIITPLKDRIGSEIRTHYPSSRRNAMEITSQEAWLDRGKDGARIDVPAYVREVVEEIAFQARADRKIDRRSGVSQRLAITCLENVLSNAERRALSNAEGQTVPRVTDVYAALPSITGKFEMEYVGELKGADNVARELIRASVATVFAERFDQVDMRRVIEWFDLGGSLQTSDTSSARELLAQARGVQGLVELAEHLDVGSKASEPVIASAVDFVLEGLYAQKKISRSEERGYHGAEPAQRRPAARAAERDVDEGFPLPGSKKKYYN